MPKIVNIRYNPALSVKDNATRNGVSETSIRNYIQKNNLDRRHDRKQNIIADCKKYLKKHPNASRNELQRETGHSLSTIRQYWEYITTEKELTDFNEKKQQKRTLRQDNDFYATHPSITQDLLGVEDFNKKVLEPFCGNGMIAETLINNGYEVEAYDLMDRGYGKQGDFFKVEYPEGEFDIVTNPPYDNDIFIPITKRCLRLCKSKVAFLLPLSYLAGINRWNDIFSQSPPAKVYVYVDRVQIGRNGQFDESLGNHVNYAWFVWLKGYQGKTEIKWITNINYTPQKKIAEIKAKIDGLYAEERKNAEAIEKNHSVLPCPSVLELTKWEEYDASKYLCYAFKQRGDLRKGRWIPFGNMNGGFPFSIGGFEFQNSESAYIAGLFSLNKPKHVAIQEMLLKSTNGKLAKGDIRFHNQRYRRKDFYDFNVQWMFYVVWQKIQGNQQFRDLLMAVPEGATIIEDTTFKGVMKENDTSQFWGARNKARKEFGELVDDYISKIKATASKATKKKLKAASINDFCDYGVFEGSNVMGKILTICKQCLHDGTPPDIDYALLRSKRIYLMGNLLTF